MTNTFSISKTFRIIARWPLLFLFPFILVLTGLLAYVANIEIYRSNAIVLFQSNYIPVENHFTILDKIEDQPVKIVRSLLYGEPVKSIIDKVWPEIKNDELAVNGKIGSLRSKNGLKLKFQRDNSNALSVSYDSKDPQTAYNVVKATIESLKDYNRQVTEERLASGVEFLKQELEVTKGELSDLEQRIVRARSGLPLSVLEAHNKESDSLKQILDLMPFDYDIEGKLAKSLRFDESISELSFELEISQKELEQLKKDLESKEYLNNSDNLEEVLNPGNDQEIGKISSMILTKQELLSSYTSKGFLGAHPDVRSVKNEIENLSKLKQEKLFGLQSQLNKEDQELTNLRLEKLHRKNIENKQKNIEEIKDRITATKAFHQKFQNKDIGLDDKLKELSDRKALLLELENKKLVASHSYAQMAKRLEVISREGRVDQDKFGLSIKVAENPKVPNSTVPFAGLPIVVLGVVVCIAVLFTLATIMSLSDTSIFSSIDLFTLLNVPVIGVVDSFITKSEKEKKAKRIKHIFYGILIYSLVLFVYFKII